MTASTHDISVSALKMQALPIMERQVERRRSDPGMEQALRRHIELTTAGEKADR